MPVALYLRVSTEEQRERQSIATQRELAERYCALHQLQVSAVYADDGVSGIVALHQRPAGARILPEARLRRFDQLLVYKLDRLGRETRLTLEAVAELELCGVRVKSLTEDFDTATASGRLMLTLLSGFAAHEREVIRERSLAGSQRVAERGGLLGGTVPYGYRKEGSQRGAKLVLSEEPVAPLDISEAEVIRRIYRLAAEEQQSCPRIADYLNALGVPCAYVRDGLRRKGRSTTGCWRAGRVRNLLISTVYKGQHLYGKRSRNPQRAAVSRAVPALVSEAVWQQAQETLQHNIRFAPRHCRHAYLLRGLVKCGLCGLTYIAG
jgi:site-specific DNA recombinase